MIIAELSIVLIGITCVWGIKIGTKKLGYRIQKKKLKKLLYYGFSIMDLSIIKNAILSLKDFDGKYNTKKVEKYLLTVIKENPKLNEKNVLNLSSEFLFDTIFDIDEKEEEEQLSIIDEKLEETKEVLNEVEKRRQEIMLRKNQIRQRQMGKSNKRRISGGMG